MSCKGVKMTGRGDTFSFSYFKQQKQNSLYLYDVQSIVKDVCVSS